MRMEATAQADTNTYSLSDYVAQKQAVESAVLAFDTPETDDDEPDAAAEEPEPEEPPPTPPVESQKVHGIYACKQMQYMDMVQPTLACASIPASDVMVPHRCSSERLRMLLETATSRSATYDHEGFHPGACFARPCPPRARHGFVPSRVVHSVREVRKLAAEAHAADPDAKIVLAPYVPSCWGAVWTHRSITIGFGSGHAATDGLNSVTLPINDASLNVVIRHRAHLREDDYPYIELVGPIATPLTPVAMQIRGGPAIPRGSTTQYVPPNTKRLIRAIKQIDGTEDLLAWETWCKGFSVANPETELWNTVVFHPGGSLSSHYGVHCLLNKIPYFTTEPPPLNLILDSRDYNADATHLANPDHVVRGLLNASNELPRKHAAALTIFVLHNPAVWLFDQSEILGSRLVGMAMSYAVRLALCAIAGEIRHFHRRSGEKNISRESVHEKAWLYPRGHAASLHKYYHQFVTTTNQWPKGGYGGHSWARCTQATIRLIRACDDLIHYTSPEAVQEGLAALNQIVHVFHNNGSMLNKYLGSQQFTGLATNQLEHNVIATAAIAWAIQSGQLTQPVLPWGVDHVTRLYRRTHLERIREHTTHGF